MATAYIQSVYQYHRPMLLLQRERLRMLRMSVTILEPKGIEDRPSNLRAVACQQGSTGDNDAVYGN